MLKEIMLSTLLLSSYPNVYHKYSKNDIYNL